MLVPFTTIQAANYEAILGSRLFGSANTTTAAASPPTPTTPGANKPVVLKVGVPLIISRESPAVHRLEVRNEPSAYADAGACHYDSASKKTSIMISGDDCYSTVNVNGNDSQPMYHASVVVNGGDVSPAIRKSSTNTVSISVTTPPPPAGLHHDAVDFRASVSSTVSSASVSSTVSSNRSIIPIHADVAPQTTNPSRTLITVDFTDPKAQAAVPAPSAIHLTPKSGSTSVGASPTGGIEIKDVISNDYELLKMLRNPPAAAATTVAAVVQIPHICGKNVSRTGTAEPVPKKSPDTRKPTTTTTSASTVADSRDSFIGKLLEDPTLGHLAEGLDDDIVAKLIENSLLRLKESRRSGSGSGADATGSAATKDDQSVNKMIEVSLLRVKEERHKLARPAATSTTTATLPSIPPSDELADVQSNRDSMSSANSFSSANYEAFDFDTNDLSDCYQSCSSELTTAGDDEHSLTRSRFYQMLVDATLSEIEISTTTTQLHERHAVNDDDEEDGEREDDDEDDDDDGDEEDIDHHYESIRLNGDPIYEEIHDMPPPLPLCPPPNEPSDAQADKKLSKSMFEGASKYDILSYLVDAKERGVVTEDTYTYNFNNTGDAIIIEEDATSSIATSMATTATTTTQSSSSAVPLAAGKASVPSSQVTTTSDKNRRNAGETPRKICASNSTPTLRMNDTTNEDDDADDVDEITALKLIAERKSSSDIERNDSGVGSETSKNSRSKYQSTALGLHTISAASASLIGGTAGSVLHKNSPIHLCEDCDGPVETQCTELGVMFAPLVCRKCAKKRAERKEIVSEMIETEEKYSRDLQIILEEFYQPMLVAGLLTQEQLSAIFLNAEELLENSQSLADRMRDAFDIALEQGDDDLLTVNIGRLMLDAAPMLHAFESYCVRQAAASLLLANMEKEKELLRIFLRVSQMENTVLRRMNLNSFLMVRMSGGERFFGKQFLTQIPLHRFPFSASPNTLCFWPACTK